MADLKISQLSTETNPDGQFAPVAAGGANKKIDLGAAIDSKVATAIAGDISPNSISTDTIKDSGGAPVAHIDTGELIFDVPVKFDRVRLISTTTLPIVEGTYIYHDTWKCMVGFNGTKVIGFTEWANYVASAASNQSGIGSSTVVTNDGLNVDSTSALRYYGYLYDPATGKIQPDKTVGLYDTFFMKFGITLETTSPSTNTQIFLAAYDSGDNLIFSEPFYDNIDASATTKRIDRFSQFYWGPDIYNGGYFKVLYTSDKSVNLTQKGWRIEHDHR